MTPICDRAGFDFEVKTERHILVEPLLTTEKRLRYYSRTPIHPHHQLLAHEFLSKRKTATLGEMFDFFELRGSERAVVLALLYHNFILTDYSLPLGLNSPIWVASTGNNEGGHV